MSLECFIKLSKPISLGLLSAILLVISFPPWSLWWFGFIGMTPFFINILSAKSYKECFWTGFSCSVAFILGGFRWISFAATNYGGLPWFVGKLVLVLYALFGEMQFLLFAFLAFAVLKKINLTSKTAFKEQVLFFLFPILYIGIDYIYPKIFPTTLGYALYGWLSLSQIAEYTGVYGLTCLFLMSSMAIALVYLHWKRHQKINWAIVSNLVILALILFAFTQWGNHRLQFIQELEKTYTKTLKVDMIQANIGDMEKLTSERGFEPAVQLVLETYKRMSLEARQRDHPDLIIWPETAYPFLYTHFENLYANRIGTARDMWVEELMGELKTPLVFGGYSVLKARDFNSAFLLKPPFLLGGIYQKFMLLPFGEYVPLGPLGAPIKKLIPAIADFGRGPGPVVMDLELPDQEGRGAWHFKFSPQICYEGIIADYVRQEVLLGADGFINITNDSWFGRTSEPYLHLLLTIFRSIETRRPLLRSTNTGVTTLIERTGKLQNPSTLFEQRIIPVSFKLPGPGQSSLETFYLHYGDLFAKVCSAIVALVVTLLLLLHIIHLRKRFK